MIILNNQKQQLNALPIGHYFHGNSHPHSAKGSPRRLQNQGDQCLPADESHAPAGAPPARAPHAPPQGPARPLRRVAQELPPQRRRPQGALQRRGTRRGLPGQAEADADWAARVPEGRLRREQPGPAGHARRAESRGGGGDGERVGRGDQGQPHPHAPEVLPLRTAAAGTHPAAGGEATAAGGGARRGGDPRGGGGGRAVPGRGGTVPVREAGRERARVPRGRGLRRAGAALQPPARQHHHRPRPRPPLPAPPRGLQPGPARQDRRTAARVRVAALAHRLLPRSGRPRAQQAAGEHGGAAGAGRTLHHQGGRGRQLLLHRRRGTARRLQTARGRQPPGLRLQTRRLLRRDRPPQERPPAGQHQVPHRGTAVLHQPGQLRESDRAPRGDTQPLLRAVLHLGRGTLRGGGLRVHAGVHPVIQHYILLLSLPVQAKTALALPRRSCCPFPCCPFPCCIFPLFSFPLLYLSLLYHSLLYLFPLLRVYAMRIHSCDIISGRAMCQCVLFDCCWFNCCGQFCAGWHAAYCLCSAWCFKPDDLKTYDPECCHFLAFDGWGSNCFCCGTVWFVSEAVREWSDMRNQTRAANAPYVVVNQERRD